MDDMARIKHGQADLARGLYADIMEAIVKYDEAIQLTSVLGVLELVKHTLVQNHLIGCGDEDDEGEEQWTS